MGIAITISMDDHSFLCCFLRLTLCTELALQAQSVETPLASDETEHLGIERSKILSISPCNQSVEALKGAFKSGLNPRLKSLEIAFSSKCSQLCKPSDKHAFLRKTDWISSRKLKEQLHSLHNITPIQCPDDVDGIPCKN